MKIDTANMKAAELNDKILPLKGEVQLENCLGQRFIGAGQSGKTIVINGVPGNALGAYLDGATIIVNGNAQDATGDTMNCGKIIVYGSSGDATGYAMRGGEMYIKNNVGYRAGIHMKAYAEKTPVIVVGGKCGSFLGEYQAGGLIVVLGIGYNDNEVLGEFCGTGMHGGKIVIRADHLACKFPKQINVREATPEDLSQIAPYIKTFSKLFDEDEKAVYKKGFYVLTPNTTSPYKQLYVQN
ncbi:MAG: glutamate synthase [Lachnospiraceae bacterium]|nr:glutamate synthase [Lachnospiraceae bacterium]